MAGRSKGAGVSTGARTVVPGAELRKNWKKNRRRRDRVVWFGRVFMATTFVMSAVLVARVLHG